MISGDITPGGSVPGGAYVPSNAYIPIPLAPVACVGDPARIRGQEADLRVQPGRGPGGPGGPSCSWARSAGREADSAADPAATAPATATVTLDGAVVLHATGRRVRTLALACPPSGAGDPSSAGFPGPLTLSTTAVLPRTFELRDRSGLLFTAQATLSSLRARMDVSVYPAAFAGAAPGGAGAALGGETGEGMGEAPRGASGTAGVSGDGSGSTSGSTRSPSPSSSDGSAAAGTSAYADSAAPLLPRTPLVAVPAAVLRLSATSPTSATLTRAVRGSGGGTETLATFARDVRSAAALVGGGEWAVRAAPGVDWLLAAALALCLGDCLR